MAYYYCDNVAHGPKPLIYQTILPAPICLQCHNPTQAAQGVVRFNRAGDYDIVWHETGGNLHLMMRVQAAGGQVRHVLFPDDVLAYDTAAFDVNDNLPPPGGGNWFGGQLSNYGGGRPPGRNPPAVSASLNTTKLKLGQNVGQAGFGLAHVVRRHPEMLGTIVSNPTWPAGLNGLRDNLRGITATPQSGLGIRWIAVQDNGRYIMHGVSPAHQHGMLVVSAAYSLVTAFSGTNMGGLSHQPVYVRDWR